MIFASKSTKMCRPTCERDGRASEDDIRFAGRAN